MGLLQAQTPVTRWVRGLQQGLEAIEAAVRALRKEVDNLCYMEGTTRSQSTAAETSDTASSSSTARTAAASISTTNLRVGFGRMWANLHAEQGSSKSKRQLEEDYKALPADVKADWESRRQAHQSSRSGSGDRGGSEDDGSGGDGGGGGGSGGEGGRRQSDAGGDGGIDCGYDGGA